ncbi:hypothetical protein G6F57_017739 [Rhizopus arrhizus]|nr:hypothetical protein G6F57_017739 [Rhizopus arrhizus]
MGGDGAVTLPQLRAVARRHPDFVVLHFDSHTDTYPIPGYNTATTFTRAAEEGLLDVASSFHVGTRGGRLRPGPEGHACGHQAAHRPAPGLPVLRHGHLRPLLRAGRVHAGVGRVVGQGRAGAAAPACGPELRGFRRQYRVAAARRAGGYGLPGRHRDAGILRVGGGSGAAVPARASGLSRRVRGIHSSKGKTMKLKSILLGVAAASLLIQTGAQARTLDEVRADKSLAVVTTASAPPPGFKNPNT